MAQQATNMLLKHIHNTIQYKKHNKMKRQMHIAIESFHNSSKSVVGDSTSDGFLLLESLLRLVNDL